MKVFAFMLLSFAMMTFLNRVSAQVSEDSTYLYYRQYCFYDGSCTDSLLYSVVPGSSSPVLGDSNEVRIYETEQIARVNPSVSTDAEVISKFFESLQVYNYCAAKRKGCLVDTFQVGLFFSDRNFKKSYEAMIDGKKLELKNLSHLNVYGFAKEIKELTLSDGQVILDFGDGVILYCHKSFYEHYLFPCCLNFISKESRLTPKNIAVPKLELGKH